MSERKASFILVSISVNKKQWTASSSESILYLPNNKIMQTNKWKIWDTVFKPSGLDPLVVTRCLIVWALLTDHAIAKNYNTWKKLDEYEWWDAHQIDYRVIEEWREWISYRSKR